MFKFNLGKSKKVFEKLNKMDRKQAYTIGAIVVVLVVALMLFVSSLGSQEDDSFAGMQARGYDLAQMPFVNDEAEKYLLAAKYPDMRENASTLLYSAAEKEARQEADEEAEEAAGQEQEAAGDENTQGEGAFGGAGASAGHGYGGYRGGSVGRGGKTEIGTLGSASMGSASGSGMNSYYGPSGDFKQFGKKEGYVAPAQLQTNPDARNTLGQFRSSSYAANRLKDNKMINARRAAQGATFQGANAFGKEGIDVEKLGGLALDTSAPPTTSDLDNLDKKVKDAAKDADKPKDPNNNDPLPWWQQMLQDLAKQAASALVGSVMDAFGDSLKGAMSGNSASRAARSKMGEELGAKDWNSLSDADKQWFQKHSGAQTAEDAQTRWNTMRGSAQQARLMKNSPTARASGKEAKAVQIGATVGTTDSSRYNKKDGNNKPCNGKTCGTNEVLTASCDCVRKG